MCWKKNDSNDNMEPNYAVWLVSTAKQEKTQCDYTEICYKMALGMNTLKLRQCWDAEILEK